MAVESPHRLPARACRKGRRAQQLGAASLQKAKAIYMPIDKRQAHSCLVKSYREVQDYKSSMLRGCVLSRQR